jgi:hypothetical protein
MGAQALKDLSTTQGIQNALTFLRYVGQERLLEHTVLVDALVSHRFQLWTLATECSDIVVLGDILEVACTAKLSDRICFGVVEQAMLCAFMERDTDHPCIGDAMSSCRGSVEDCKRPPRPKICPQNLTFGCVLADIVRRSDMPDALADVDLAWVLQRLRDVMEAAEFVSALIGCKPWVFQRDPRQRPG